MSREYFLQPSPSVVYPQIDYARELNEQQLAAVTAPPGPALVIAGAGSGKTRTLTYRVAYLIEQGTPPERILLLTFTNKAAQEMMRRVADLLGHDLRALWGGTFHAIGNRSLRQHAALVGWQRDFTILDREDALDLMKACVRESQIDVKATKFPKAEVLAEIFSLAVNTHRTVPEAVAHAYGYFEGLTPQIVDLARRYAARKRATNSMDFDDLLAQWLRLLQEHAAVREHYQRRFQYVLVDEYQDTNKLQSDLIDLLAAQHHNVMVVGDDAQSIYGWRGANFENILKFPERFPDARVYRIETNYRSTPQILEVANAAIAANLRQHPKQLVPARPPGAKPARVACQDAHQQAAFVAQRVLELREEGQDLNQMAVLYRSHFHALELQLELTRQNIPFSITSGMRFFEQAHIKDVTAYLKLVVNPRDELAFRRLALMWPGVGAKGAEKLWRTFAAQCVVADETLPAAATALPIADIWDPEGAAEAETAPTPGNPVPAPSAPPASEPVVAPALRTMAAAVPKKAAAAWAQFTHTVEQLETPPTRQQPAEMIRVIMEAGYEDYLHATYDKSPMRLEHLEELGSFSRQFASTEEFLTQLALLTNIEAEDQQAKADDSEMLRLSTIHQAKGLEFDVVFVIMLCDGLFPSARSLELADGEEEERRLFYVAVTRARNELYVSYPLIRAGYNPGGDTMQIPSRFLGEIPAALVEEWNLRTYSQY
jgi:DNA helicase-2/ATP-dependent DNA helicase PcrA